MSERGRTEGEEFGDRDGRDKKKPSLKLEVVNEKLYMYTYHVFISPLDQENLTKYACGHHFWEILYLPCIECPNIDGILDNIPVGNIADKRKDSRATYPENNKKN